MSQLPTIAIVGRPNVGKSTLVNRIVGGRQAVVEENPGVTRDRRQFNAEWAGRSFLLMDTGGWELGAEKTLSAMVRAQAKIAVEDADLVLFVTDATTSIVEDDAAVAKVLRRSGVPVLVVANKVDRPGHEVVGKDLWSLGLGEPIPVSAFHGLGVGDLLDRVVDALPPEQTREAAETLPRLVIVGQPNVGKSTLLNRLAGERRVIVAERPGTTRDPIDVEIELGGRRYLIIDTAGIRRRPQITEDADFFSVLRAREALRSADVALLVLDADHGVSHADQRIGSEVIKAGVGLVLVINKWDLVDKDRQKLVEAEFADRFGFAGWAPVVRIAATTGRQVSKIGPAVEAAMDGRRQRIPTASLNRLVAEWTAAHPPPVRKGRRPRLRYAVQAGTSPPTFVLFVAAGDLADDYLRFIEGKIRQAADFTGSPVHVMTHTAKRE